MKATELQEALKEKTKRALELSDSEKFQRNLFIIRFKQTLDHFKDHAGEQEGDIQLRFKGIFKPLTEINFFDIDYRRYNENDTRPRIPRLDRSTNR